MQLPCVAIPPLPRGHSPDTAGRSTAATRCVRPALVATSSLCEWCHRLVHSIHDSPASLRHIATLTCRCCRGLPANERCLALAASSGHLDTAAWLADSGCSLLGTLLGDTLMPLGTRHQHPQVLEVQSDVDHVVGGCAVLQVHRSAHAGREAVHPCRVAGVRGRESLTSRPWMRTLDCPLCWVWRWSM